MRKRFYFLLFLLACCRSATGQMTYEPLPKLAVNRRGDWAYMDSAANGAKQRYRELTALPPTAQLDTLRFKTLYHLGSIYKWWYSRRDSALYYGTELVAQARKSRNLFYEVNGKIILEDHYRTVAVNTPQALRLNFEILTLLPQTAFYDVVRLRTILNLSDLYGISKDYASALRYLSQAKRLLTNDLAYAGTQTTNLFRVEVEQHMGAIYKQQNNFSESETHYLAAEAILQRTPSETSQAYIYDDLGELYLEYKVYDKALAYAKKAEALWDQIKTATESHSWGTLACVYAGLGQDELALQYAHKVLELPKPNKFIREQAYMALHQVAEHRQDWKNAALYHKKYVAMHDTILNDQRSLELAAIQKRAEFDRLALHNQQAQQLQNQRLLTVQKQAELDRLRASTQTEALARQAERSEHQRLLDNERAQRAQTTLARQQALQELQRQTYERETRHEQRTRLWLLIGLSLLLVFTTALAMALRQNQRQKRQIEQFNADLERTIQIRTAELQTAQDEIQQKKTAVEEAMLHGQTQERQRIATDLHDDLGGTLATIRRRIDDIRQHITDPAAAGEFASLEPLIQKSSDDLRRIAHNLMPPEFARMGLRSALEQLIRTLPRQPTHFEFLVSGPEHRLPLDTELNLYRIVSELVQNILKHAQARRAAVQLLYEPNQLSLLVEDDGVGIQQKNLVNTTGIGLKNSNLRADYIGATLRRETGTGGTMTLLELPYSPTHATYYPNPSSTH